MDSLIPLMQLTGITTLVLMLSLWIVSLIKKDASIVDIFWGLGFVQIAFISALFTTGFAQRRLLITTLVFIWGVRLSLHIFLRNAGKGEDFRYKAMRAHHGARFPLISLFSVFLLQGALMFIISLPLQVGAAAKTPERLTWLDYAGIALWLTGFLFEAIGDWQLKVFKSNPDNAGKVMDSGLWRYSRHPNYFGDALLWWGYFLIALATPLGVWTIFSPLIMTLLLMKVSGVALLEKTLVETKPEYAEYVRRTSSFFPWPPRG